MKSLTLFLSALMMWGYSLSAAADPSCEGRFVNPITDVCWQCIFPMSIGSVSVAAGGGPDTVNPASPVQYCPAPPPIFVRIGSGDWLLGADGHDGCQPFTWLHGEPRGIQYQSRQDRDGYG
nr:conjugal transfer pilus assembly protein TraU [Raoultella sp. NCTC 9187]